MSDCGCNQITCGCCGNQSTQEVCGDFDCPDNPDLGRCSPYRVKLSCEAPVKPENPCNDSGAYAIPDPDFPSRFIIVAGLFDENCLPILDENSIQIQTLIQ